MDQLFLPSAPSQLHSDIEDVIPDTPERGRSYNKENSAGPRKRVRKTRHCSSPRPSRKRRQPAPISTAISAQQREGMTVGAVRSRRPAITASQVIPTASSPPAQPQQREPSGSISAAGEHIETNVSPINSETVSLMTQFFSQMCQFFNSNVSLPTVTSPALPLSLLLSLNLLLFLLLLTLLRHGQVTVLIVLPPAAVWL